MSSPKPNYRKLYILLTTSGLLLATLLRHLPSSQEHAPRFCESMLARTSQTPISSSRLLYSHLLSPPHHHFHNRIVPLRQPNLPPRRPKHHGHRLGPFHPPHPQQRPDLTKTLVRSLLYHPHLSIHPHSHRRWNAPPRHHLEGSHYYHLYPSIWACDRIIRFAGTTWHAYGNNASIMPLPQGSIRIVLRYPARHAVPGLQVFLWIPTSAQ